MITTTVNLEYALRMAGVALLIAAMGVWFTYDGAIGYPRKNEEHLVFVEKLRELQAGLEAENKALPTAAEWLKENDDGVPAITQFANQAGVELRSLYMDNIKDTDAKIQRIHARSVDKEEAAQRVAELEASMLGKLTAQPFDQTSLNTQFGFAVFGYLFAGFLLLMVFIRWRARPGADDGGIVSRGRRYAYSELTGMDWKQWHDKQIVRLAFGNRVLTLDGWFHTRVDEIVALVLEKRKDFTMPERPAKEE